MCLYKKNLFVLLLTDNLETKGCFPLIGIAEIIPSNLKQLVLP